MDDLSPLTEAAPSNRLALDVLRYAWLSSMHGGNFTKEDAQRLNEALKGLVASFSGTDATTLLEFLGNLFYEADALVSINSEPCKSPFLLTVLHSRYRKPRLLG